MSILATTARPDYVALAMVVVFLGFIAVLTVRKYIRSKHPAPVVEASAPVAEEPKAEPQPQPRALGLALAPLPLSGQLRGCWGWER